MDHAALQSQIQGVADYAGKVYTWRAQPVCLVDARESDLEPEVRLEPEDENIGYLVGSASDPAWSVGDPRTGDLIEAPDGRDLDVVSFTRPTGRPVVIIAVTVPRKHA